MDMELEENLPSKYIKQIPTARRSGIGFGDEVKEARNSPLYWWYECLRASDEYRLCCQSKGKGELAGLYQDFGDVFEGSFAQWWMKQGRKIFAERKPLKKVRHLEERRELDGLRIREDRMLIEIPLTMRKQTVMRQIGKLLKVAYQDKEIDIWEQSSAKRQIIKSKVRMTTVELLLKVLKVRNENLTLTNFELGKKLGIELDLLARNKDEVFSDELERRRMTVAVSRYLRQAKNLIANAERGIFPSIK